MTPALKPLLAVEFPKQLRLSEQVQAIFRPPPRLTVSQWADRFRYLHPLDAPHAGRWKTSRTPYMREVMDSIGNTAEVSRMVFMKAARVGGTEALNNGIAYAVDSKPRPVLYLQPEREAVEQEFTGRLKRMFESSGRLRVHIPRNAGGKPAQNWCTGNVIKTGPATVYGGWASSPNTMIRKTVGLLTVDEIDNVLTAETGLGNFFDLVAERVVVHDALGLSTIVGTGTPSTTRGSGWRALENSDWRTYHVPCPACGEYQQLQLSGIEIHPHAAAMIAGSYKAPRRGFDRTKPKAYERDERPTPEQIQRHRLGVYRCRGCEALLPWKKHHQWMIDRGFWIPRGFRAAAKHPLHRRNTAADRATKAVQPAGSEQKVPKLEPDPDYDGRPIPSTKKGQPLPASREQLRGYHLSVLYSPFASRSHSHILAQHLRVAKDPEMRRVFTNSWLAEPWREVSAELPVHLLDAKRRSPFATSRGEVPRKAKQVLVGVDVQKDHCWMRARAYGPGGESWGLFFGQVWGTEDRTDLEQVIWLCYQLGFRAPAFGTPEVPVPVMFPQGIIFDRRHRGAEVDHIAATTVGVYTASGMGNSQVTWQFKSVKSHQASTEQQGRYNINTDQKKAQLHRLIQLPEDHPSAFHFAADDPDDYLEQLSNEQQVMEKVKSGRFKGQMDMVFRPKRDGARVDALDTEVYLLTLAESLGCTGYGCQLREHEPPDRWLLPPYRMGDAASASAPPSSGDGSSPIPGGMFGI